MGTRALRSSLSGLVVTLLVVLAGLTFAACAGKVVPAASMAATSSTSPMAGPTGFQAVTALVMDPSDPSTLYAATPMGLFKSSDGAASWERLPTMREGSYGVYIDPAAPLTIYAIYPKSDAVPQARLGRSDDGDATWVDLSDTGAPKIYGYMPGVWFDATSTPSPVYMWGLRDDGLHVFRSTDRGENWTALRGAAQKKAAALQDAGRARSAATWITAGPVLEVTGGEPLVDPHRSWVHYAGTKAGVYKSLDSGRTWHRASAGL